MKEAKYCFGDFEYSCPEVRTPEPRPIISVALIVCDEDINIIDKMYRTIKPSEFSTLSKRCKQLTGITQNEIDSSYDFDVVSAECIEFLNKYNLSNILVWGYNDFKTIRYDFKLHRSQNMACSNIKKLARAIENVEPGLMKNLQMSTGMGLKKLQTMFNVGSDNLVHHNALDDTILLSRLFYVCTRTNLKNQKEYQEYLKEKQFEQ